MNNPVSGMSSFTLAVTSAGCHCNWRCTRRYPSALHEPDLQASAGIALIGASSDCCPQRGELINRPAAMLQVELSSFQSFYKASSKSPFKTFPWKSGSMHFRFLPVSPPGQPAPIRRLTRCMPLIITSPGAISQQQASASICTCVAIRPHTSASQCPLQAALLRCLDNLWHAAASAATLALCHAAPCPPAACCSRPVHHSVDLQEGTALQTRTAFESDHPAASQGNTPLKPQKSLEHD